MVTGRTSGRPLAAARLGLGTGALLVACLAGRAGGQDAGSPPRAGSQARSALRSGGFPWYDPDRDDVRPLQFRVDPPPKPPPPPSSGSSWWNWSWPWANWSWGETFVFVLFTAALVALGVLVFRYWKRFEPTPGDEPAHEPAAPSIGSGEVLPAALRPVALAGDLWAEADRRRTAGDLAGAVVCLFAHQLLSLSRLGLVRLVPGRTGRQLQRSVADRDFQALVLPTLRQFEAVYYGHRAVEPGDFATVWASAESFQRRLAEQGHR